MHAAVSQNEAAKIQLLVPIYNEGENVLTLYKQLEDDAIAFDSLKFVYDFDGDSTLPFIAQLNAKDPRVIGEKNEYGRGVINALKWGLSHAVPGPVIVMMGDNSDKLSIIPDLVSEWQSGATVVCPSRYMKGGAQHGGGFLKSNLSRLAGKSLKLFGFPTADPTNSFKLYDGSWLCRQNLESSGGFEVGIELCYKAYRDGKKIVELPTIWKDREMGKSNFKLFQWLPHYLRWYLLAVRAIFGRRFASS